MMNLAAFLYPTGYHVGAWRLPEVAADGGWNFDLYRQMAQAAEAACFDFVFLADSLAMRGGDYEILSRSAIRYVAQLEPLTLVSALTAVTRQIGFIASASTTYTHPFHVARAFASLDHISGGRVGWNLITSQNQYEALNFGLDRHPDHAARYARAAEYAEVVLGLWQSWDEDAFVLDKEGGRFFNPDRMHHLNHDGEHFRVRGPLHVPRSPQGRPVIVQAGASPAGRELAARTAEIVFTAQNNLSDAKAFYSDIKQRVAAAGRDPDSVRVMPGIMPVVGATRVEAEHRFERLQDQISPVVGLSLLEGQLGEVDLTTLSPDDPVPPLNTTNASKSRQELLVALANRNGWTIRDLYLHVASSRGHLLVVEDFRKTVDLMEEWFREGAADGFNIMPASNPAGLQQFIALCVPELQHRGLFRRAYDGQTLRAHLRLPA
ncbi:LLM class flavin-dependent oxidoreductase [Rhizobium johnstonii]|uniref:LLM class flavin-dependent oxidoreductase n=1 Tax=Rhizobium johnstonii TaxID=3019933 RepID=UPI003F97F429